MMKMIRVSLACLLLVVASVAASAQGVQPSGNSTVATSFGAPLYVNGSVTGTGTIGSSNAAVTLAVSGLGTASFGLTAMAAANADTVTFECTVDGANWFVPNTWSTSTATANGIWSEPIGGCASVRARMSTYASGTPVATIIATLSGGSSGSGGSGSNAAAGATGAAVPGSAGYVGLNSGGNLVGLSLGTQTAGNSLPVALPSATITTLTPPAAITGFALDTTLTGRLPAGATPGDGESNTSASLSRFGSFLFGYNGTTWDRLRADTTNGLWVNVKAAVGLTGTKTHNTAVPGATNLGVLFGLANATAPTYTEGNQVLASTDLHGSTRATLLDSSGAAITPSTTVTEAATITRNQSNSSLTASVLFADDGSTDSRLRSRAGLVGSGDVGLVVRPLQSSDGTNTTPTMDAATRPGFVVPTASATGGATPSNYISAATNNSTNLKASAGTLYSLLVINTTATLKYLRLYDSGSAPTCTSATGVVFYTPIPANSTTGAGLVEAISVGLNFASGIGWCITGGSGTTDNTSTAAGDVVMNVGYK